VLIYDCKHKEALNTYHLIKRKTQKGVDRNAKLCYIKGVRKIRARAQEKEKEL